jgi:aspartyl protease family protein
MSSGSFPQRLGKGMIVLAWLGILGLMTLYFDRFLEQQNNPNQQITSAQTAKSREVTLQRNRAGHYVATARINDQTIDVMLDTGATTVSIPGHIAKRLQLLRGPAFEATTANGTVTVFATVLDRIQLGNIALNGVRASINPYMEGDEVLLGMSFLKQLEFTQRGDQLILRQYDYQYH